MFHSLRSFLKFLNNPRNKPAVVHAHRGMSDAVWHDTEPLMEIVEGNEESDWVLWENSVASVDSQPQSLGTAHRSTQKSDSANISPSTDVFNSVGKNST